MGNEDGEVEPHEVFQDVKPVSGLPAALQLSRKPVEACHGAKDRTPEVDVKPVHDGRAIPWDMIDRAPPRWGWKAKPAAERQRRAALAGAPW